MKNGYLKVATASPEIKVGDCLGNAGRIIAEMEKAEKAGVKLLVFPELSVTSYTIGDLISHKVVTDGTEKALTMIKKASQGSDMLVFVGFPYAFCGKLYNCSAAFSSGKLLGIVPKTFIPEYAEFYETRSFAPAPEENREVEFLGDKVVFGKKQIFVCRENPDFSVGCEICEDLLVPESPSVKLALSGANVIVNLSASDETAGKAEYRRNIVKAQSSKLLSAYIYANCSDGESTTDLVFSGHSLICELGKALKESEPFQPEMLVTEIDLQRITHDRIKTNTFASSPSFDIVNFSQKQEKTTLTRYISPFPFVPEDEEKRKERCSSVLSMQAAGLCKRMKHIGCKNIVVGISGGLDSCLALLVMVKATDILGKDRKDVIAVTMPCFGTTKRTKSNAEKMCEALGVTFMEVNISETVLSHFRDIGQDPEKYDVTFENSQARERTQVLMDIANQKGGIVIGTGDLSELALGWATYNGDHMSMYGVNGSVPKTLVRHLVKYYADTCGKEELKKTLYDILGTPVSPELIPPKDGVISQVTEDIVGPYELHDFFLFYFLRYGFTPEKIYELALYAFGGRYDEKTVSHWLSVFMRRFMTQQFKRSCLPDGPKVGSVAVSPRGDLRMASDTCPDLWKFEEIK